MRRILLHGRAKVKCCGDFTQGSGFAATVGPCRTTLLRQAEKHVEGGCGVKEKSGFLSKAAAIL
jgi:hypothetical protein